MHSVFMSYSSKDARHALTICKAIEARGIRCWISSRDVRPGEGFQDEIMNAIGHAKVMILVFSANANNSGEIKKELALASQSRLTVIPVRIEDVIPSGGFAYEFATRQWIDLFADWDDAMQRLTARIDAILETTEPQTGGVATDADDEETSRNGSSSVRAPPPPNRSAIWIAALIVLLGGGAGGYYYWRSTCCAPPPTIARETSPGETSPARTPVSAQQQLSKAPDPPAVENLPQAEPSRETPPEIPAALTAGAASVPAGAQVTPPSPEPTMEPVPIAVPVSPSPSVPRDRSGSKTIEVEVSSPPAPTEVGQGGQTFRDCEQCPAMVVIADGSAMIGSPAEESGHEAEEGPRRLTRFAKPFAISLDAITYAEWDACVAAGGCGSFIPGDMGWGRGQRPVVLVSWHDAKAYVTWLSQTTGASYRLPSESEWEYTARGCRTAGCQDLPFWFGATINPTYANYDWRYAYRGSQKAQAIRKTSLVGTFGPNPFGLFNAVGNVAHWTEDCWNDDLKTLPTDGTPRLSGDCSVRVVRGGSWKEEPVALRSAARKYELLAARQPTIGFRVLRNLEQ